MPSGDERIYDQPDIGRHRKAEPSLTATKAIPDGQGESAGGGPFYDMAQQRLDVEQPNLTRSHHECNFSTARIADRERSFRTDVYRTTPATLDASRRAGGESCNPLFRQCGSVYGFGRTESLALAAVDSASRLSTSWHI